MNFTFWDSAVIIMALAMSPAILAVAGGLLLGHRKSMAKLRLVNPVDHQQLQSLAETAQRLEQRIFYLENVLDAEAPGWRSRSDQR
jgi:phage shock protein B